jgi:hypothetical protein
MTTDPFYHLDWMLRHTTKALLERIFCRQCSDSARCCEWCGLAVGDNKRSPCFGTSRGRLTQGDEAEILETFISATFNSPAGVTYSALEERFTEEEVWGMIKSLPPNKVPGPDGFHHSLFLGWLGDNQSRLDAGV